MFISLPSTCIQNFSNWHVLFDFFIRFCSHCGMKWDTACRPTDDPFWAFLSPSAQEPVQPPNNICLVLAAEKNIYIGHSSKKDNHPFHSKAFVLLYKFETSWALLGRLSSGFFLAISGASNFKHFKQLFMTLSGLGLLTMWELPRRVSYFVSNFLQNYFSWFCQDFPFIFCLQNLHFSMIILPPNIRIFPDKPCLCSHVAERFCVKGVYLLWYSQKPRKEFEQFRQ